MTQFLTVSGRGTSTPSLSMPFQVGASRTQKRGGMLKRNAIVDRGEHEMKALARCLQRLNRSFRRECFWSGHRTAGGECRTA